MKMEPPAHFLTPRLNSSFRLFLAPRNILALIPSEGRVKTGATEMTTWPRGPGKKAWPFSRCFCLHARHSARIRAACTQFLCSRGLSVAAARYFHHPSAVDSYYWTLGRRGRVPVGIQVSNSRLTVVLRSQVLDRGDRLRLLWILTRAPLNRPASPITSTPCVQLSWTRLWNDSALQERSTKETSYSIRSILSSFANLLIK